MSHLSQLLFYFYEDRSRYKQSPQTRYVFPANLTACTSLPETEYVEGVNKARAMLQAIEMAEKG